MQRRLIDLTRNQSSDDLVNADELDYVTQTDDGQSVKPLQVMDKPLVENATYTPNHGSVNYGGPVESEKGSPTTNSTIPSPGSDSQTPAVVSLESMFSQRNIRHPTTNCQTMMHILKGNIGTGILAIPEALKYAGLTVGTVGIMLIGIICVHCMHILVRCAHALYVRERVTTLDYMDVAELSFKTGPRILRNYHKIIRVLTIIFLCVTQFGFCCVYLLFVSQNLEQVLNHLLHASIPYQGYMAMFLPILVVLTFIRNLKHLSYFSLTANVLQAVSFCILFYLIIQDLPPSSSRKHFATWDKLPLWFGIAIYSFEGISLVLPLENKMKSPQDFGGWTGVMNTGMVLVACMYAAVGFYGYLRYGDDILGSITLNLDKDGLGLTVRLAYAIAIFLSYLVQFYVPIQIIWPIVKDKLPTTLQPHHNVMEYTFRAAMVVASFILPAAISDLGPLISLVGALSGSYLTVILPPILELATFWDHGISKATILKDIFICIFGILGFVTGTFASIKTIVDK